MCGDYGTEVRLLAVTNLVDQRILERATAGELKPWEALVEHAGRLCWDSQDKTGSVPDRIEGWIKVGHESVIEHSSFSFYIRCSRVVSHELVRHRIGVAFSQRSQRYVKETEAQYIQPPELEGHRVELTAEGPFSVSAESRFKDVMEFSWKVYRELLASGVKPEIARYVLPNACQTEMVFSANLRELRHVIRLRTSHKALPEMREVAGKIRDICVVLAPHVFGDLKPERDIDNG